MPPPTGGVCHACQLRVALRTTEEDLRIEVLAMGSQEDRVAFIEQACGDDPALRRRLFDWIEAQRTSLSASGASGPSVDRSGLSPADPDLEEGCLGRYQVLEKLGEGGFGTVYLAEQRDPVRRRVAIKVLKSGMDTAQVMARFEVERQTLAMMDHPHIARVLDAGRSRTGRPFFAMELVAGEPITRFCARHHLSLADRLRLFVQVCEGLQHAHHKGIIHRDIKPSNVLVAGTAESPQSKIIDFGIAKAIQPSLGEATLVTTLHQFVGTPAYISPEQVLSGGKGVDTRSDLYSLGVLLYELLTGVTPFDQQSLHSAGLDDLCRIIREREPIKPSLRFRQLAANPPGRDRHPPLETLPADLDWIVLKCLHKDRNLRYATAHGLAMDLGRFLQNEPILARPPSVGYRVGKWVGRNPVVATLSLIGVLGLILAAVMGNWMVLRLSRAKTESDQANRRLSQMVHHLEWENVEELAATKRRHRAMSWFAKVLRDDPTDTAAASRVLSMLTLHSMALPAGPVLAHDGPVRHVRFHAQGSQLLTASDDGTARLWEVRSGRELRRWSRPSEIHHATLAVAGSRLVLESSGRFLQVLDVDSGSVLLDLPVPDRDFDIRAGLVLGDERTLISLDQEPGLRLWNLESGTQIGERIGLADAVQALALSESGKVLAVGMRNTEISIFDLETRRPIAVHPPVAASIGNIHFTPDGERLFISPQNFSSIAVWKFRTENRARTVDLPDRARMDRMVFRPDGGQLVSWAYGDLVRLWDADSLREIAHAEATEHAMGGVTVSKDATVVATYGQFGTANILDGGTLKPLLNPIEHPSPVWSIALDDHGHLAATGSQDGGVRVWDIRMRRPAEVEFPPTVGSTVEAAFSPDGSRVLVATRPDTLQVFEAHNGQTVGPPLVLHGDQDTATIWRGAFSPDGRRVLGAGRKGRLQIWDTPSGHPLVNWHISRHLTVAAFSPDGRRVVAGFGNGDAWIADATTGKLVEPPCHDTGEVTGIAMDPRGGRFATSHADGFIRRWNLSDGKPIGERLTHPGIVWNVAFSPDGKRLVSASADRSAQVWDADTGVRIGKPMRLEREVVWACFSPGGDRVLTTGSDGSARIWDAATGDPVSSIIKHSEAAWQGRFSPDGLMVATGSLDGMARLWDATSGLPRSEPLLHESGVLRVSFSPEGQRLLTFGGGRARLWQVLRAPAPVPPWFPELIEAIAGQRWQPDGGFEPISPSPILVLRDRWVRTTSTNYYERWAGWFLNDRMADPALPVPEYPISPSSMVNRPHGVGFEPQGDHFGVPESNLRSFGLLP